MSMILFIDSLFVTFDKGKSIVSLLFFQIQPKKMLQLVVFRDKKEISLYVWSQWMWCKCMTNERTKMTLMLCSPQYYDMQACILICPHVTCLTWAQPNLTPPHLTSYWYCHKQGHHNGQSAVYETRTTMHLTRTTR